MTVPLHFPIVLPSGKKGVDVPFTGNFDFSRRINVLRIDIGQNLEHGLWVNCWISAFGQESNLPNLMAKPVDKVRRIQYNFYGILIFSTYLIIPWIADSSEPVFCF